MSLYKKYKSKGLVVIGIDPYDKNADDLKSFLAKEGVKSGYGAGVESILEDVISKAL